MRAHSWRPLPYHRKNTWQTPDYILQQSLQRTATGGGEGAADYYCSLNTIVNISSTMFVLTIPVKSLMSISKTPRCFDCWNEFNTDNPLTLSKGHDHCFFPL